MNAPTKAGYYFVLLYKGDQEVTVAEVDKQKDVFVIGCEERLQINDIHHWIEEIRYPAWPPPEGTK